jgi:dienelactone hydrolase
MASTAKQNDVFRELPAFALSSEDSQDRQAHRKRAREIQAAAPARELGTIPAAPLSRDVAIHRSSESISSNHGPIPLDIFRPSTTTASPALLFLYGSFGLTPNYIPFIEHLAKRGYLVLVPHYFSRTGTIRARDNTYRFHFFPWLGSLIDAFGTVRSRPQVDSARIGLVGVSLGAALALSMGAQLPGIKAVVEFSGHIPAIAFLSSMPPTMIVHGGADKRVPVRPAINLAMTLKKRNIPCELVIYPGELHVIRQLVFGDAVRRATEFLAKYL